MTKDARRDPRFQVTDANLVSVVVVRKSDDTGAEEAGELLDLSRGGLRLRLNGVPHNGDKLRLTIAASQLDSEIEADATVRWVEPDSGDSWIVGCVFQQRIAQDSLEELAADGTLERRSGERRVIAFTAEAKTELEPGFKPVQIVDISDGGFCALAEDLTAKPNDRMLIRIKSESEPNVNLIRARVAWINELEGGRSLGCLFLTKADHALLHAMSHQEKGDHAGIAALDQRRLTKWSMVGAAVLVIIFVQFFLLEM